MWVNVFIQTILKRNILLVRWVNNAKLKEYLTYENGKWRITNLNLFVIWQQNIKVTLCSYFHSQVELNWVYISKDWLSKWCLTNSWYSNMLRIKLYICLKFKKTVPLFYKLSVIRKFLWIFTEISFRSLRYLL
jgi:hypothetical protein